MSEVENEVEEPVQDYKSMYEETQKRLDALAAHQDKLLGETKKAKQAKEEAAKAELERSKKAGEYEKLWSSAEERAKEVEQRYLDLVKDIKNEKVESNAMKIAVDLADGDAVNAKLLSKFIKDALHTMSDDKGSIDDGVMEAVKKQFRENRDYSPLLGGSKAAGGGANGSNKMSGGQNKMMSRSSFDNMTPAERMSFIKAGGTLTND